MMAAANPMDQRRPEMTSAGECGTEAAFTCRNSSLSPNQAPKR